MEVINGVVWRKYYMQAYSTINNAKVSFSKELSATSKEHALDDFDNYLPNNFFDNGYRSEILRIN